MKSRGVLACAWLIACGTAMAQDASLRLEPMAERIAKLHAQLGQGVMPERSRRSLAEALREFEATLRVASERAAPTTEAREAYLLLRLLWRDYRAWAMKPPTPDVARQVDERREEIAWVAARAAKLGPAPSGGKALARDAASLATAAQGLARRVLLRQWGIADAPGRPGPAAEAQQLRESLARLRASRHNTAPIATELEIAEGQLAFLLEAVEALEAGGAATAQRLEFVAKASDHFQHALERAAALYEGAGT